MTHPEKPRQGLRPMVISLDAPQEPQQETPQQPSEDAARGAPNTPPQSITPAPRPARPAAAAPAVFEAPEAAATSPQDAPPVDDFPETLAPAPGGSWRMSFWARLLGVSAAALFSLGLSVAIYDLVMDLLARNAALGWISAAFTAALLVAGAVLAWRELAALGRMRKLDGLKHQAAAARAADDVAMANALGAQLQALYQSRTDDMAWDWDALRDQLHDAPDASGRLDLFERAILAQLDAAAAAEICRAARHAAAATAIAPSALLDSLAALAVNIRLIRRVAAIYGGRGGAMSSWKLARRVAAHAMAAGLISMGDDLLEPLIGGGVASKLSRRMGEGVVNGAITVRLGVAAMEVCRPMPFVACKKPKLRDLAWSALGGK